MSGEDGEHPPPHAVASWNEGGHPLGWEMVLGGFLCWVGLAMFIVWVATFDDPWAVGIVPFAIGAILLFHTKPILGGSKASSSGTESHHA